MKAFEFVKTNAVDLILLDINMPNLSGIQFIKSLSIKQHIILTTAYSKYAVESYGLDVLDYLLKPIEFERFFQAVNKVFDRINQISVESSRNINIKQESQPENDYVFLKDGHQLKKIMKCDILYIEASGNYQSIQFLNKKILVLIKMDNLLKLLGEDQFTRIHKSFAVNVSKIIAIENHRVSIGEKVIPISGSYRVNFYHIIKVHGL